MPGPQPKKMLILNILQILKDYTDSTNPDHKLTQKEIMEHLEHDYDMVVDVPMIPFGLMNALTIKLEQGNNTAIALRLHWDTVVSYVLEKEMNHHASISIEMHSAF